MYLTCAKICSDVQHYGAWAVVALTKGNLPNMNALNRVGAGERLKAAIACFPKDLPLQQYARHALSLLEGSG